jgi:hypothetical protein
VASPDRERQGASGAGALRRHDVIASGVLTGIAGGVGMVVVATAGAAWQDLPALHALGMIGESFVGPDGLAGGGARLAFGAVVHLATAAALGVVFAGTLSRDFPTASALVVGQGFALFTIMFLMPLVVPWANPGFRGGMQAMGGTWVLAHAVFGFAVGLAPALRRSLVHGAAPAPAEPSRAGAVVPPARAS